MLLRLRQVIESYIFVLAAALAFGLFVPHAKALAPWSAFFLQIIFFFSSLKLQFSDVRRHATDWKLLVIANLVMLIGLPLLTRLIAPSLVPDLAFSLFLLSAMPVGMTSPLLVEVVGGKQELALVLTVVSSLVAPLSIPFVTHIAYSASVRVDIWNMVQTLFLVICIPFALAVVAKFFLPKLVNRVNPHTKPLSILLLGGLIAGAISQQARTILDGAISGRTIGYTILVLCAYFVCLHIIGYWALWWKSPEERRTVAVCLTYMNFTLAIFLAGKFFPQPHIVLPLVLSMIPWVFCLPAWKKISARMLAHSLKPSSF